MNGIVLWRGRSRFDRSPVAAIACGLERLSENIKTGPSDVSECSLEWIEDRNGEVIAEATASP